MSSGYRARRIPVNVTDSGRCFNGLFRTRNVIEGLILAAGPALLVGFFFNPAELTLKIQVLTVAAGLPLVAGVFGVPPYSLVEFLSLFIRYSKEKHYAKYNPRLKWETKPEYLIHGYEEPFTKTLMNALDLLLNRDSKKEETIDRNITNPTHDERFIEDADLLRELGQTPDDLKTPSQLRAEAKAKKKEAKEAAKAAKRKEREERRSRRKGKMQEGSDE